MLDRLRAGLVSLPDATYDLVLLVSSADGTRSESQQLLDRQAFGLIAKSLRPGGYLRGQDGGFAQSDGSEKTEAILAGLSLDALGARKPETTAAQSIPLKLGKRVATENVVDRVNGNTGYSTNGPSSTQKPPPGVGFVDFSDDLDEIVEGGGEDDLIDEDSLLTEEDRTRGIRPRRSSRQSTLPFYQGQPLTITECSARM